MAKKYREVLGIDIGGVIIENAPSEEDTSFFSENYLQTPAVAGAIEIIHQLVDERFGTQHTYLVSKAGTSIRHKTHEWLDHHNFYEETGITPKSVIFCRERREKANICRAIRATHFIDDRLEILGYLGIVDHRYLFRPHSNERDLFAIYLPYVTQVNSWQQLARELLPRSNA